MKLSLIILLIVSFKLSAQDLEYLKSQDTIYLSLEILRSNIQVKKSFQKFDLQISGGNNVTQYDLYDNEGRLIFITTKRDLDDHNLYMEVNRKRFLKKNKKKIITTQYIDKIGSKRLFFDYLGLRAYAPSKKVFYIFDEQSYQKKEKKIILTKAYLFSSGYIGI